jgi:hypothetical protein
VGVPNLLKVEKLEQLYDFLQKPVVHVIGVSGRHQLQRLAISAPIAELIKVLAKERRVSKRTKMIEWNDSFAFIMYVCRHLFRMMSVW